MKPISEYFQRFNQREQDERDLTSEAKQFKTPSEFFPKAVKVAFFIGLALLNVRLFHKLVPGNWGYAIGACAALAEGLAFYCLHNFSRAAGWFRLCLGLCGSALAAFTLGHSVFSFFDMIGVPVFAGIDVHGYAQHYAFPILAVLLGGSAVALSMTHPKNLIRLVQAQAHTDIVVNRAQAASKLEITRAQSIIDNAELERERERAELEEKRLDLLQRTINAQNRRLRMLAGVENAEMRDAIARDMGIDPATLPPVRQLNPWTEEEEQPRKQLPN